jgi:hypothetical protein
MRRQLVTSGSSAKWSANECFGHLPDVSALHETGDYR